MISVFNPTKLEEIVHEFSVFPNPFNDIVILDGYENFEKYYIKDLNGKLIKSGKPLSVLNFEELEIGIYNLILINDTKISHKKIIEIKKMKKLLNLIFVFSTHS